jgi:hypothetical protein
MKRSPTIPFDDLDTYLSIDEVSRIVHRSRKEFIKLVADKKITAYVAPPANASVYRVQPHLFQKLCIDKNALTQHLSQRGNPYEKAIRCESTLYLQISTKDYTSLLGSNRAQIIQFIGAVGATCTQTDNMNPKHIERLKHPHHYILSYATENSIDYLDFKYTTHLYHTKDIIFHKSVVLSIEKPVIESPVIESPPIEKEVKSTPTISSDDKIEFHEKTSIDITCLFNISKNLWRRHYLNEESYPDTKTIEKKITDELEGISKTQIKTYTSIIRPEYTKKPVSEEAQMDREGFLSSDFRTIIEISNVFHKNNNKRSWLVSELRKKGFSANLALAGQTMISPTNSLSKNRKDSANKKNATHTLMK